MILAVMMAFAIMSCGQKVEDPKDSGNGKEDERGSGDVQDIITDSLDGGRVGKSLNDIRFGDDFNWLDNDYICALRSFLDEYADTVKNVVDKKLTRSQFVVWCTEAYLLGGMLIYFVFLDSPNDIYSAWVYSDVDEETETIIDYSVRGLKKEDEESGLTREDVLQGVSEDDRLKLW